MNDGPTIVATDKTAEEPLPIPSATARGLLPLKAVRIDLLDERGEAIVVREEAGLAPRSSVASGFLVQVESALYLYTCWHVVTGIDLVHPKLPGSMCSSRRRKLRISMQAANPIGNVGHSIGGLHSIEVDLYDDATNPPVPLWEQDEQSVANESLSMANLSEPFWHDVVRLRMPETLRLSNVQAVHLTDLWSNLVSPGDSLLIVGYPYGYSAHANNPTPIVLKRSVAAVPLGRHRITLVDGGGAPGMSGGPVFYEFGDRLFLYGIYVGVIYPDAAVGVSQGEKTTALGRVCPLGLLAHLKLSQKQTPVPPPFAPP